jgi:hypothetical protein
MLLIALLLPCYTFSIHLPGAYFSGEAGDQVSDTKVAAATAAALSITADYSDKVN